MIDEQRLLLLFAVATINLAVHAWRYIVRSEGNIFSHVVTPSLIALLFTWIISPPEAQ